MFDITYGDGYYVAVGDAGRIYSSQDAVHWNLEPSGGTSSLRCVTFANGQFLGIGNSGEVVTITPRTPPYVVVE
jgi:photosystem II stability/assembly factor-like uncharacterized protein